MTTRIQVFGSLDVTVDGRRLGARDFGGRKPRQLLELLVLSSGRFVPKDQLAQQLWDDELPHSVSGSLEHYVSMLRRRLSPGTGRTGSVIVTDHGGYRLDPELARVDLDEFDARYGTASRTTDRGAIESTLALVTGELLEDEPYAAWAVSARSENRRRRLQLHVAAGELALASGDLEAAANHGRDAVAIDNLFEAGVRLLMTAGYRRGEQTQALQAFTDLRRALAEDVGADPMPQTRALYQAVLRHQPTPATGDDPERGTDVAVIVPAQRRAPVRARPATAEPAQLLGREQDVRVCLDLHRASAATPGLRSVLVRGETGIGKSALLDEVARRLAPGRVVRVTGTEQVRSVAGALLERLLVGLVGPLDPPTQAVVDELVGSPGHVLQGVALRELDDVLATRSPFVLLVDDAHLADDRSLQVLATLGTRPRAARGLLVLAADVARTSHDHRLRTHPADAAVDLRPLTVEHLMGLGVPNLHRRSGGLPLLVAGARASSDGPCELPADAGHRVLASLRSAGEACWRVVVACSLAGERFGPVEVARLAGLDGIEVAEAQERLCELRVLDETPDGYRFRYPMVRDLVHDEVSAGRRRLLRRQVRADVPTDRRSQLRPPPGGHERRTPRDRRGAAAAGDLVPSRTSARRR